MTISTTPAQGAKANTAVPTMASVTDTALPSTTEPTNAIPDQAVQTATAIAALATPAFRPVVTLVLPTATAPSMMSADSPPDHISIPVIGVDAAVQPLAWVSEGEGDSLTTVWQKLPGHSAGWHVDSAYPGRGSNVVISGHHNIDGEVFRDLVQLQAGDEIEVTAGGQLYRYRVAEILILPERDAPPEQRLQNASWMQPTKSERLTLITCWPYETNTHRLIVIAQPESNQPKVAQR
ncbi:MAG: sortase [Anaerolineae bacterium]